MIKLTTSQTLTIAGGLDNEEIGKNVTDCLDNVEDVFTDTREDLVDQLDKIADKIHSN